MIERLNALNSIYMYGGKDMSIKKETFGRLPDGREACLYTLTNKSGACVAITNYGGILVKICVPDRLVQLDDVILGYSTLDGYANTDDPNPGYFGALIGRYANRIHEGKFTFHGKEIQLAANSNGQHLHGGNVGFDKKLWDAEEQPGDGSDSLVLTYTSPDGEENYPGTLKVKVTYTFTDACELKLHYEAETDKDTICNLTNHAYFDLEGEKNGSVEGHTVCIAADKFTVVDKDSIPTGELRDVTDTLFDFRAGKVLADGFAHEKEDEQMTFVGGYDHNFVVNETGMRLAAVVTAPKSGRIMTVYTDQPGIQLYTGNMIECSRPGKCGRMYEKRDALCLETQYFPDSVNQPEFPSCELKAGDKYDFTTVYSFTV